MSKQLQVGDVVPEDEQKGILATVAINRMEKKRQVVKHIRLGWIRFRFQWRSARNLMGRFGGGWNWRLGFQAGGHTLQLHFLVFSLTFSVEKDKE